jgi:hypothetical protein
MGRGVAWHLRHVGRRPHQQPLCPRYQAVEGEAALAVPARVKVHALRSISHAMEQL